MFLCFTFCPFIIIIITDLLELADCYCETELKRKCEVLLKQTISVENALKLYTIGVRYQAKVSESWKLHVLSHTCSLIP